ncbi:MAG: molybdopterin-dependent oxidoreductase, partial [Deltaproteobacteria bacterium]|nr:molybdopterin-dependent oxidoreductase [Deltaproteobacteria bacterium]
MSDDERTPGESAKLDRVVEARMRLKARFEAKMAATPSVADDRPMGEGDPNRHGMPKLPPGQYLTHKWPVLDLGNKPQVAPQQWSLTIDGAVEHPLTLDWAQLNALPQVREASDFHCVTTWSRMDMTWTGVRLAEVLARVQPTEAARFILCHGYDGYTTNIPLEEALKSDVLLGHTVDGQPLPREHGGPVRLITPQLYAWKGTKWIKRMELLA